MIKCVVFLEGAQGESGTPGKKGERGPKVIHFLCQHVGELAYRKMAFQIMFN